MIRIASYGAGVNSTAMILHLLDNGEKIDYIVFANTFGEYPETYEYISKFAAWLAANHNLSITTVQSSKGSMYEHMFFKRKVPSFRFPAKHVEEWKIRPIDKFCSSIRNGGEIEMCLGIDFSERDRQRMPRRKWIRNRYPLIDTQMNRYDCTELIKEHQLPVPMKSGCWFCPFQNKARWLWSKKNHPILFEKSIKLEENNPFFPGQVLFYGGPLRGLGTREEGQTELLPEPTCQVSEMCGR